VTQHIGARLSLEGCYRALAHGAPEQTASEHLLARRHWIHETGDFDARTGDLLPGSLGHLCARVRASSASAPAASVKDRLYRILEHVHGPLEEILRHLHEGLVRQHASLPLRAVRELDTASFFALSRRSGRTIREKLADRPYLLAVERRWTVDTAENRLVKAFCLRVTELLRTRVDCRGKTEESWLEDLRATIDSWLLDPAVREIGRWENLPPNNFVLQHRDYRRVWDAWSWTQTIDEDLRRDHGHRLAQWTAMAFWTLVARLERCPAVRLLEQPCYLDYESFAIVPGRTGSDAQAIVEGVIAADVSGRTCGLISRLGVDRNGDGFGVVTAPGGASAFFHSRMFPTRAGFDQLSIGTALAFDLIDSSDGKPRAANPTVVASPREFRVELNHGAQITLRLPIGAPIVVNCEEAGERVKVRVGSKIVAVEMSPQAAVEFAELAMRALPVAPVTSPQTVAAGAASSPSKSLSSPLGVVDLCFLRPRFGLAGRCGTLPLRLLWQRWQQADRDPFELDLGDARAIALGANIATVSILDLLAPEPPHAVAVLNQAARFFAAKVKDTLQSDALTYIVPDATDEFALGTLRRAVNAAFRHAEPLPRSVASVFDWQSSPRFAASGVADGDCVLVLDTVGATLSATPLRARKNEALKERLPASHGIYWERSPCIQSGPEITSVATAASMLARLGCTFPDVVARLWGFQGLVDEGVGVSWQDEAGGWYTAPCDQEQAIKNAMLALGDPWARLARGVTQELNELVLGARVFILFAGDIFRGAVGRATILDLRCDRELVPLGFAHEPHQGGMVLHRWQELAGDIPLWRDRLPELSMRIIQDGRYARFNLVKDATVPPRRGCVVVIPIADTFILKAKQSDYQFPLLQGSEHSELHYEAFLSSPAFPLNENLPVTLALTYSYGTDTPYDLVFRHERSGLTIRAEWRPRAELPAHFPALPDPDSWARFNHYPKDGSTEESDLLEWIRIELQRIGIRMEALAKRRCGVVTSDWRMDRRGKRFLFVNCNGDSVFCHENDFISSDDTVRIGRGSIVSLDVEPGEKSSCGRFILLRHGDEPTNEDWVLQPKMADLVKRMKKALRFPFLTVWSDGHSLIDPDAPSEFRITMLAGIQTLFLLLQQHSLPQWLKGQGELVRQLSDGALFLLCCLHKDAPIEVAATLRAAIANEGASAFEPKRYGRHIALALGDAELKWQSELLDRVLMILRQEPIQLDGCGVSLQILGMALWRCGALLSKIKQADLVTIVGRANAVLHEDLSRLSANPMGVNSRALKDHLELVLALLRTRASDDAEIRGLLAPGRPTAKALARTVEKIIDVVSEHDIPMESRITLAVEKPPALHNTPDLLYALQLYLTGNEGARAIQVMAVKKDEELPEPSRV